MMPECDCRNGALSAMKVFYELERMPVHSVLLMPTREKALNYPKGDLALGFCPTCGFIGNTAFDPGKLDYSTDYEETQAFSNTFNDFHRRLATRLIARYDLHGKAIIEIGCGKGEFLTLLCELGGNRGVGFDPAYVPERNLRAATDRLTFINDFYSEKYASYRAEFICCKMTLEHVQHPAELLSTIRRSIGSRRDTVVFFQVPDVMRILRELAFWDIYYEHCSYFSLGSLARLFRRCGFDVVRLAREYADQYLLIEARPGTGDQTPILAQEHDLERLTQAVDYFSDGYQKKLHTWQCRLREIKKNRQRAIIWGASSKGVSFLNTLRVEDEIGYVVDINPYKQGTYIPGTGHQIVSPDILRAYKPNIVIVMNPIYREEIGRDLTRMGLAPELITV